MGVWKCWDYATRVADACLTAGGCAHEGSKVHTINTTEGFPGAARHSAQRRHTFLHVGQSRDVTARDCASRCITSPDAAMSDAATRRRTKCEARNDVTPSTRTPLDQLPEFLRVEEVAHYARTSRSVIYEMVKRGDLRGIFFGRLLRISREALAALVNSDAGSEQP